MGNPVAVKELLNVEDDYIRKLIAREVILLKNVRHQNCVSWLGVCSYQGSIFLITEYVPGGDLRKVLKTETNLPWSLRIKIIVDICAAMTYLHSRKIMHRDLKSKNVLIESPTFVAKLCDFGFARIHSMPNEMTVKVGTEEWMAPGDKKKKEKIHWN
jgi:LIM domain kinase 1